MLIETFYNVDYFELGEEETLDLIVKNNNGIAETVVEDEYEETSYMMESSSISIEGIL